MGLTLLNEFAASRYIGMSTHFLRVARSRGVVGSSTPPPPHYKVGSAVKYSTADLDRWLSERRVDRSKPKPQQAAAAP